MLSLLLLKNILKGEHSLLLLNGNSLLIESFTGHFVSLIWFLVALFWGRIVLFLFHQYMSKAKALLLMLICFVLCVYIHICGKTIDNYVPFYLVDGFVGAAFMEVGYLVKGYDLMGKNSMLIFSFYLHSL